MSEPFSGAGEALRATVTTECLGGTIHFTISSSSAQVVRDLCITAVSLGVIYAGYKLIARRIDGAVRRGLGGERGDQGDPDIRPGSLHVLLRCYTDERFLEVLADYESGRIKERLEEEFFQVGIKVEGMNVEINNKAEVNKTKEAINRRYDQC